MPEMWSVKWPAVEGQNAHQVYPVLVSVCEGEGTGEGGDSAEKGAKVKMDAQQLTRFFPLTREVAGDTEEALETLYRDARAFADSLQRLLPESQSKMDLHMRLFHIVRDAEMALRLDGPTRTQGMIVMKQ